jgi:phytoene dehydrogenase-like protein
MSKKMIIVGAGISGLSTGFYGQLNGFQTTIFEMHTLPGGLCAAWTRKGYKFDISMHLLAGSRNGPFHKLWEELGVLQDQEFHYHKSMGYIDGLEHKIDLSSNAVRLEEQMLAISPADAGRIREFTKLYSGPDFMGAFTLDPPELIGIGGKLRMFLAILPMMRIFRKYSKLSIQEFSAGFREPFLGDAIRFSVDTPGWPMVKYPMVTMAGFSRVGVNDAGNPSGGSFQLVSGIAERYRKLGGEIHYKSKVKDILIENGRASGILLEDGTTHTADIVVWAADGHHLLFDILKGKFNDAIVDKMYNEWIPVQPMVHVCFGVNMDLSGEPQRIVRELEKPVVVGGREFKWISILLHNFDPTTAPPGKTCLEVWYSGDYAYWETLAKDRPAYEAEKKRIADLTADELEKKWPGFRAAIEVTDVPTPVTYVNYTGNWKGSPDGWYVTVDNLTSQSMKRSLPGLKDLYMVGQWTAPYTGTVMAASSGRQLIQLLCRSGKKRFISKMGEIP